MRYTPFLACLAAATVMPGSITHAGEIQFTFGLTRSIDACEDTGALLRYQSGGQWYEIPKADVKEITGLTCAAGAAATSPSGSGGSWEPDRYVRMTVLAAQATQRGNLDEAERQCAEMTQYVAVNTVASLVAYADLLGALKRQGAEAARERADRFRQPKPPGVESAPLGFDPSAELRAYARVLQETGRPPYEVSGMTVLAGAWHRVNLAGYHRNQDRARGIDVRGRC